MHTVCQPTKLLHSRLCAELLYLKYIQKKKKGVNTLKAFLRETDAES